MSWNTETTSTNQLIHSATCSESSEAGIQASVLACADHAFTFLRDNIVDDSMYCLFEWHQGEKLLSIYVTDETKKNEGKHVVRVDFTAFTAASDEDQIETVKFWLRDHLTTCTAYFQFSLVAGFSRGDRSRLELL